MSVKHGPWTIREHVLKYRDEFIEVYVDEVLRPDGQPGTYATIAMKPGVSVLPLDEDEMTYLARQFRYAVGRESVEAISGAIDEGESPEQAAKRELKEEAGIEAAELTDLGQMDIETSIVRCPVRLYLAKRLTMTEKQPEGTEQIAIFKIPFREAVRMAVEGEITHGPTCALIFRAQQQLRAG